MTKIMEVGVSADSVTKDDLKDAIRSSGSDDEQFFGYPVKEDGLFLQQDPEEFASFVEYLANKCPPSKLSIDVGIAAGGNTKFVRDYYQVDKTIIVDIGQHPRHSHWQRIKSSVKSDIILEIIEDSHAPHVRERLIPFAGQIDYAFVDGDHSYRGLRQDIFLMKELLKPGAIMALHDTHAVADCNRVFEELKSSEDFELLENFVSRFGISIWRFKAAPRKTGYLSRKFGWGRL
jgi:hypothetical protein